MENVNILSSVAQIIVALSIGIVWVYRFDNVVNVSGRCGQVENQRQFVGNFTCLFLHAA
jgi:uncharacterized membrane protein YuzA (DUF378 family)